MTLVTANLIVVKDPETGIVREAMPVTNPDGSLVGGGGGGGGGAGPTVTDYSAVLTGASDTIVTAGQAAHYLAIQNPTGNADVTVNIAGGDATTGGIVLVAGGSLTIDFGVANAVTIAGTAAQSVIVFAG
jgi:hypothetical protein